MLKKLLLSLIILSTVPLSCPPIPHKTPAHRRVFHHDFQELYEIYKSFETLFRSGYNQTLNFYHKNSDNVHIVGTAAAVAVIAYILYKKLCPVAARCPKCQEEKASNRCSPELS